MTAQPDRNRPGCRICLYGIKAPPPAALCPRSRDRAQAKPGRGWPGHTDPKPVPPTTRRAAGGLERAGWQRRRGRRAAALLRAPPPPRSARPGIGVASQPARPLHQDSITEAGARHRHEWHRPTAQQAARCLRRASAPGWGAGLSTRVVAVVKEGRASRHAGAEGVADQGEGSRSFSASGAPPGPLPLARFGTSPPTRRDARFTPLSCAGEDDEARAVRVLLGPVSRGHYRHDTTPADRRSSRHRRAR